VIIDLDVDLYPIVLKLFAPINAIAQTYPGFILLNLFCCFFYSLGISGWTWSGPATPSSSPHRLLIWLLWQPAAPQCT